MTVVPLIDSSATATPGLFLSSWFTGFHSLFLFVIHELVAFDFLSTVSWLHPWLRWSEMTQAQALFAATTGLFPFAFFVLIHSFLFFRLKCMEQGWSTVSRRRGRGERQAMATVCLPFSRFCLVLPIFFISPLCCLHRRWLSSSCWCCRGRCWCSSFHWWFCSVSFLSYCCCCECCGQLCLCYFWCSGWRSRDCSLCLCCSIHSWSRRRGRRNEISKATSSSLLCGEHVCSYQESAWNACKRQLRSKRIPDSWGYITLAVETWW